MPHRQPHHRFARVGGARVWAVLGFRADDVEAGFQIVSKLHAPEHRARAFQNRLAAALRFFRRVNAGDEQCGLGAPAIHVGRRDLVAIRRRPAARPLHQHALRAGITLLGHQYPCEVAHHIRQHIGGRVANLIQHLLCNHRRAHQAAGAGRLGHHERAISMTFNDGIAVVGPIGHALPIGKQTASGLRAAFDDVAGQRALGQPVVVIEAPIELMHQGAERHRAIDAAPGDDHIRAALESGRNRNRAEVSVGRENFFRQCRAGKHFSDTALAQRGDAVEHIVAFDHRDLERHALFAAQLLQGRRTGARVHAARIAHHLDALGRHVFEH